MTQLLQAATELFAELGYRAVTTRMVAEKAGISTRTLFNYYPDKISLFEACLDQGSKAFPTLEVKPGADVRAALTRFAADIVHVLSTDSSMRLGALVYREGGDFPEVLRASEQAYNKHQVQPVMALLRASGAPEGYTEELARTFVAMALSEWYRRSMYRLKSQSRKEIERHAELAVALFLDGVASTFVRPLSVTASKKDSGNQRRSSPHSDR
ncbi:MAG: TetR/AcrR family transcriptional regulator [Hyphomonadaceae bacterium]|nr:TetR/AcrR family transcriptional regulator [Hyphomonadaceae bacterium]